jgi:hypothetical protein
MNFLSRREVGNFVRGRDSRRRRKTPPSRPPQNAVISSSPHGGILGGGLRRGELRLLILAPFSMGWRRGRKIKTATSNDSPELAEVNQPRTPNIEWGEEPGSGAAVWAKSKTAEQAENHGRAKHTRLKPGANEIGRQVVGFLGCGPFNITTPKMLNNARRLCLACGHHAKAQTDS